jgi:hypothetical protein
MLSTENEGLELGCMNVYRRSTVSACAEMWIQILRCGVVISCMSQCLALSGRIDPSCKTFFNLLVTSHIHNQKILFNNTNYCMFIILIEKNQNWDTIHTELSPTYMVTREDRQIENEMRAEQKPTYRDHAKKGACLVDRYGVNCLHLKIWNLNLYGEDRSKQIYLDQS